jgi:hypothetical protein
MRPTSVKNQRSAGTSLAQFEARAGQTSLPVTSGLGLEMDEADISRFPYRQLGRRRTLSLTDEGP